ncbi:MAG TPA: di-heme oxidoredictase family protein [Blastocatellia bacterium]|nr:di-heme oxidoredictase family protein [Blastocatellia bacterium]
MKHLKIAALSLFVALVMSPVLFNHSVEGQGATEAPTTDMDARTNDLNNGFDAANFNANKDVFEERETLADGIGPVYNATACVDCHQSPDTGAASQISEFRAGHLDGAGNFVNAPGGSLINDRAIASVIQERVSSTDTIRTFRMSLSTLGDGFVECIDSNVLIANVNAQPAGQRGSLFSVPVFEANNALRTGRFGWKNQQASLVSFSADAYLNEMGITSPLQPTENTSNGNSVAAFDGVADPEDDGGDVLAFAAFMRGTRAPGRGAINAQVTQGDSLFTQIGCAVCHTRSFTTAPAGTSINGGQFIVPAALGNKIIHPFSDFAMHDVGTGDGILQNGPASSRNQVRTAPLWGVRARIRLMHDGSALTVNDAILAHFGQANPSVNNYINLTTAQKQALIAFVLSL